jgi:hypothetical protein
MAVAAIFRHLKVQGPPFSGNGRAKTGSAIGHLQFEGRINFALFMELSIQQKSESRVGILAAGIGGVAPLQDISRDFR